MFNVLCKNQYEYNSLETFMLSCCKQLRKECYNMIRDGLTEADLPFISYSKEARADETHYLMPSDMVSEIAHLRMIRCQEVITPLTLAQKIFEVYRHVPSVVCTISEHAFFHQLPEPYNVDKIKEICPAIDTSSIDFQTYDFQNEFKIELKMLQSVMTQTIIKLSEKGDDNKWVVRMKDR